MLHIVIELLKTRVARSGAVCKTVVCESCQWRYDYEMHRTEKLAKLSSAKSLEQAAEAKLQAMLEEECDAVPCPSCGWYQQNMVLRMRQDYSRFSFWPVGLALGSVLSFMAAFLAIPAGPTVGPWWAGACILAMVLCLVGIPASYGYRLYKRFTYNPNAIHFRHESFDSPAG